MSRGRRWPVSTGGTATHRQRNPACASRELCVTETVGDVTEICGDDSPDHNDGNDEDNESVVNDDRKE